MDEAQVSNTRPSYFSDLKWIFALLFLFFFLGAMFFQNLLVLTRQDVAVEVNGTFNAVMFSPDGLDDDKDLGKIKDFIAKSPEGKFSPFPDSSISINQTDIETLTPKALRLKIFKELAGEIYQSGTVKEIGIAAIFTANAHQIIQRIFIVFIILSLLFLFGVVYFSVRWGKLVSPAILILVSSLLPFILVSIIARLLQLPRPEPATSVGSTLVQAASLALPGYFNLLRLEYLVLIVVSLLFLLGAFVWRFRTKRQNRILDSTLG